MIIICFSFTEVLLVCIKSENLTLKCSCIKQSSASSFIFGKKHQLDFFFQSSKAETSRSETVWIHPHDQEWKKAAVLL